MFASTQTARRALGLFALSTCAALAGCAPAPVAGSLAEPIIGGQADNGDPAVVLLIASAANGSESLCTGEIVSPHVVFTAAHCVDPATVGNNVTFQVFLGSDINNRQQANDARNYVDVKETHYDMQFSVNRLEAGHDVGVVITSTAMSPTPLPMNLGPLDDSILGASIRLVGYGVNNGADTQGNSAGTKRQVMSQVSSYDNLFVQFGDAQRNTCEGDSGGPMLYTIGGVETIVGITSFGAQGCGQGSYDTRVDTYAGTFVVPYIKAADGVAPPPPVDMAQPAQPSPDLAMSSSGNGGGGGNTQPAVPAGNVGATCHAHSECISGVCAFTSSQAGYCTARCNPSSSVGCPNGLVCGDIDGQPYCVQPMPRASAGCSIGAARGVDLPGALAAISLLALRRRRRSRRGR